MEEKNLLQPEGITAELKLISYQHNDWNMTRYIWENPSQDELDYRVGDLVYPAGENPKLRFVVKDIKNPGELYFPRGGVVCSTSGTDRTFYLDAVIKVPTTTKTKKKK